MKRRDIRVDAVYDIECANWTDFVMGGYLQSDGMYTHFDSETDLAKHLIEQGGIVWAHAGGMYDHKWFIDLLAAWGYGASISAAGPRIISASVRNPTRPRNGRLELRDSFALVPLTLKKFTESQGVTKEELSLPCVCGEECGGYCSISRHMPAHLRARLAEYMRADCFSLLEGLQRLQSFASDNDLDLGQTVGSSAWRCAKRWLDIPDADFDADEHAFLRRAYYGGRVQLIQPAPFDIKWGANGLKYQLEPISNVYEYDVNAMYPWALDVTPLPCGPRERMYGSAAVAALARQYPGAYACTIDVPYMHLPPLPYRAGDRLTYPTGRISGAWALPEIEYAVSLGCEVVSVQEAIIWRQSRVVFPAFVERIFELRAGLPDIGNPGEGGYKRGKETPMGEWLKFYSNSPTGKMAMSPEKERFYINPEKFKKCPAGSNIRCRYDGRRDCNGCCAHHCSRRCGAMAERSDYIWSEYFYHLDKCAHIEWAMYLTCVSRVELHRQMVSYNGGLDVVYCDTDGQFSTNPRSRRLGSKLGEWLDKGRCDKFYGIAPKTYWFERDGKVKARAKGLKTDKTQPIIVGKEYPARGVVGLATGANLGRLFTAKKTGRKASPGCGDRILQKDWSTRPPTIEEVNAL